MRDEQIQQLTLKLLSRLNPPRALTGQAQAIKDEATFLAKCINRVAPTQGLNDWFENFEEAVLGNLETRTWPTAKELSKAASQIIKARPVFANHMGESEWSLSPAKINAKRIQGGFSVCDTWLSGNKLKEILATGLVSENDLHPYKRTASLQRDELYG